MQIELRGILKKYEALVEIINKLIIRKDDNDTDKQVKLHDKALKGLAAEIDELKKDLEKWKKNA